MKKNLCKFFMIIFLITSVITPVFSEDKQALPYDQSEFPQGIKDLRRFEIITLGALPFVTIDTTLAYSAKRYVDHNFDSNYTPNIFLANNYTEEEQKKIIMTSLAISTGIALTDYIVRIVKRYGTKRKNSKTYDDISIYKLSEDPDAMKIELPQDSDSVEENISEVEDDVPEVED